MKKRITCKVSGRVQMVMYRDFVTRSARKLGLVGEVWNKKDGTVMVIAEGEKEQLAHLLLVLHEGSVFARVDNVSVEWSEPQDVYTKYAIRYE